MRILGRNTEGTVIGLAMFCLLILSPLSIAMAQSGTKAEPAPDTRKRRKP